MSKKITAMNHGRDFRLISVELFQCAAISRPDKRGLRCADMRGGIAITDVCRIRHIRTRTNKIILVLLSSYLNEGGV